MLAGTLRENAGIMFISMIPWNERPGEANSTAAFAAQYNKQMYMADRNSMTYFMTPPPIMGLSITGGFELFAQNTEGKNYSQIEADMQKW